MAVPVQRFFPTIRLGEFRTKAKFDEVNPQLAAAFSVYDWIDDRPLYSRHSFTYPAYCPACEQVTQMWIDWLFGGWSNVTPSAHPAWTEICACQKCGLNSRMRALLDFLKTHYDLKNIRSAYIAEQITPFYRVLKRAIPSLVGSEYCGPDHEVVAGFSTSATGGGCGMRI